MTDDEYRDDFGAELLDALTVRTRDGLPQLTPERVHHRVRTIRARRAVTAAVVVLLIGVGVGTIATHGQAKPRLNVAGHALDTSKGSASVRDWTWVNDEHGWVLVRTPCGNTACVALYETTDGGDTWIKRPAPDALYAPAQSDSTSCTEHTCLSGVRFATPKVGWLFGPAFFETADGGTTWKRVASEGVSDVEAAHGVAMRLTKPDDNCGGACVVHVDRRLLSSHAWRRLPRVPVVSVSQVLLQESDAYTAYIANPAGAGESLLAHSHARGATWTQIKDPCALPTPGLRSVEATAAPGGVLAVLCIEVGGSSASVQVSTDRGGTFAGRRSVPGVQRNFGPVAAATARTVAVAYSDGEEIGVLVTNDGGTTWRRTLTLPRSDVPESNLHPVLGWQDAHTGRVSFGSNSIWTTHDGGRTWSESSVAP